MTNEEGILCLTDVTISFCDAVVVQFRRLDQRRSGKWLSCEHDVFQIKSNKIPSLIKHPGGTNGHDITAPTAVGSKLSKKLS